MINDNDNERNASYDQAKTAVYFYDTHVSNIQLLFIVPTGTFIFDSKASNKKNIMTQVAKGTGKRH